MGTEDHETQAGRRDETAKVFLKIRFDQRVCGKASSNINFHCEKDYLVGLDKRLGAHVKL